MIRSFADKDTESVWERHHSRRLHPDTQRKALRKLVMLNRAASLQDLRVPPGNRLELLRGDRSGQHSIRIDRQWRVCFTWTDAGPTHVEIADYH